MLGEAVEGTSAFSSLFATGAAPVSVDVDSSRRRSRRCRCRSGTTGFAKVVQLTQRNLVANVLQSDAAIEISDRRRDDRRAAVLPHLRHDRPGEPGAPQGRDRGHDAAVRSGRVPPADGGASRDVRVPGAADRAGAREASGGRQARPVGARARDVGRGAAGRERVRGRGSAARLHRAAGLRPDRDVAGHERAHARSVAGAARHRAASSCRTPRSASRTWRPGRTAPPTRTARSGSAARR